MPAKSKIKGSNFERRVVNIAKKRGIEAKRAYASNGKSFGLSETIDVLIGKFRGQCKIRKNIASWLKPDKDCDVQIVKENRGDIYVIIKYEKFLRLIKKELSTDELASR